MKDLKVRCLILPCSCCHCNSTIFHWGFWHMSHSVPLPLFLNDTETKTISCVMTESIYFLLQAENIELKHVQTLTEIAYKLYKGSRQMSFLWWGVSRSVLTSECPLLPSCPNPFTMMTSQSVLEASSDQESCMFASDDIAAPWFSPSVTTPCSDSISPSLLFVLVALLSRFSLLLESRCLLPSWGRRRRPCFRPVFLGLPPGLLFLLKGLPTLLMEHGVAETTGDSHEMFIWKER